jgi:ribosomal protein RSM22 (predicted rRNA methylase)
MNETLLFPYFETVSHLCRRSQVRAAYNRLQEKYKQSMAVALEGIPEHVAYVLCRMGATFAADRRALGHLKDVLPNFAPKTVLDIGCGPGGALLASFEAFPSLENGVGLERSLEFKELFHLLFTQEYARDYKVSLRQTDLAVVPKTEEFYDICIASYSFGELSLAAQSAWMHSLSKTTQVLLLIEPGTPLGFQNILEARRLAIELKAKIAAPCPHMKQCPQMGTKRWCHEQVRLFRTAIHKDLKGGSLGYEDEKFSYLVVVFDPEVKIALPSHRILHVPQHRTGHSNFITCTQEGTVQKIVLSKKHGSTYKRAREALWGDIIEAPKEEKE